MKNLDHLNGKNIDDVCNRLWGIEGALRGLGSLFEQQGRSPCYEKDELFGIGQLLKGLSKETSVLEDILRCGYDTRATGSGKSQVEIPATDS